MRSRPAVPWLLKMVACLIPALLYSGIGARFDPLHLEPCQSGDAASRQDKAARDWDKQPAVVEMSTTEDVVALGDVHGDYDRLLKLLTAGKIIPEAPATPEKVRWSAAKAVLVCTGDLIDKGDKSLPVLLLFRALQSAAAREGGRVIVLMGNHEAEFLADPGNDKAIQFAEELKRQAVRPGDVAGRDALGVGVWLRSLPFAARVNDWFFAHAGNTGKRSLKQLRTALQEGVDAHGFDVKVVKVLDDLLEARLHPAPWWETGGGQATGGDVLMGYLKPLGVNHLVIGHQPGKVHFADGSKRKKGELYQHFDGLLFLIDVGMSRGLDDNGSKGYSEGALLRIRTTPRVHATAVYADGRHEKVWQVP